MKNLSSKSLPINAVFASLAFAAIGFTACSTTHSTTDAASNTANNTVAVENNASYYTELDFNKGSTQLDVADKAALQDLMTKSMSNGHVDEVKIITWADKEYPAKGGKTLPAGQRKLAEQRNERIKDFLKEAYPSIEVSVYNMAARPNALENLFNTADARTKRTYEEAGVSEAGKTTQKASKALVMSIVKPQTY